MNRGLLSTVKLPLAKGAAAPDPEELAAIQQRFFAESPLVEALPAGARFPRPHRSPERRARRWASPITRKLA